MTFKKLLIILAICFGFNLSASAQNCPTGTVAYAGSCKSLRQTSTPRTPYVPTPIVNAEGVHLYPQPMAEGCSNSQLDSECVVTYSYTDTSLPPVISLSFTKTTGLFVNETTTSPQWTSSNAVAMSLSCSGVAYNVSNLSVAVSAIPSSLVFGSTQTGTQTCTLTATNPFGMTASASASVTFIDKPIIPKPTLNVSRLNGLPMAYPGTTGSTWSSTNATTVTLGCTSSGTGFAMVTTDMALSGSSNGATLPGWVGYPSTCTWTATGPGGVTTVIESLVTIAAKPTIDVSRVNGLPMAYPGNAGAIWSTSNATSLTLACTSTGTGFSMALTSMQLNGSSSGATNASWIGYPSTCTWTATGVGGTTTFVETLVTVAGLSPVWRFVDGAGRYFYTASVSEHDLLVNSYAYYWTLEGVAFHVYTTPTAISGLLPVYRFNNDAGGHFYTVLESEKANLIANFPTYHYESIAWYAMASQISGTTPLYRFYITGNGTHFYTASLAERNWIISNLPSWSQDANTQYVWP